MNQICPKCGSTKFQLSDINLDNSIYSFVSVQCKSCGLSLGITTIENSPATIVKYGKEILDKLEMLEKEIQKR
jgi:predicted nucleic-acid-binding Zn-ribbon protein